MTQQLRFVFFGFWLSFNGLSLYGLHILCSSAIVNEVSCEGFIGAQNVASFQRAILRSHHATENFNFNHDDYPANLLGWPDWV